MSYYKIVEYQHLYELEVVIIECEKKENTVVFFRDTVAVSRYVSGVRFEGIAYNIVMATKKLNENINDYFGGK